jgi:hypothetical protein
MADAEIYMATTDYIDYPHGPNAPTPVRAHQTARAGHPIIARTPHMWVPLAVDYEVDPAEQAMADDTDAEVRRLKQELIGLGVNVDGRWSLSRLRREATKARAQAGG